LLDLCDNKRNPSAESHYPDSVPLYTNVLTSHHPLIRPKLLLLLILLQGSVTYNIKAQENLPERLHTNIDKTLDDQFAEIEKELARPGDLDRKDIVLITVPLENYIEDVVFRINRPAVIYPRIILKVIRNQLKEGKSRSLVEQLLVEMQKHKEFDKLYDAEKQKM
jgi:hypothetical protein